MNDKHITPFVLVGCRRSGTTLLSLLLSHHPEIFFAGEMHFVFDYFNKNNFFPSYDEYSNKVCNDRRFKLWDLELKKLDFPELVNDFLIQRKNRELTDKPLYGVCAHDNLAGVLKLWPNAKIIHLVKDPRDVSSSYVAAGWAGNHWYGVNPWLKTEREWDEIKYIIPKTNYIEMQFEELVCNPKNELIKLCKFLGVDYSELMFTYSGDSSYDKIEPSKAYRWKNKSSARDISLVESKVGVLLQSRGYKPSGKTFPISSLYRIIFPLEHAFNYTINKLSVYGVSLALQHIISKRLPFSKWRIEVQKRIDVIKNNNLK